MVSSMAYYIKFDGFSPTFFNQFPVVPVHLRLVQVWLDSAKLLQSDFSRFDKVPST
jgi:hypothetical protein